MKKVFKIIMMVVIVFFAVVGFASLGSDSSNDSGKKGVTINNKEELDKLVDEEQERKIEEEVINYDLTGTVNDYVRHSKDLEGKYVLINGMWGSDVITSVDESAYVNLTMNAETKKKMESIKDYARVYVSSISNTIDGEAYLDVKNVNYINPLEEKDMRWSNTKIVDDTNISEYAELNDPYAEYECYMTRVGDYTYRLVGGYGTIFMSTFIQKDVLPYGGTAQLLLSNLHYESGSNFDADIAEYIIIDGV